MCNSAIMLAATSGLVFLTGCSSEFPANDSQTIEESSAYNDSYTIYSANSDRVHNFGVGDTRAATDGFYMPDEVTIPDDALDLNLEDEWGNKPNLNYGNPKAGVYYVKAGETLETGLNLAGDITVFVAGTLKMSYLSSSNENSIYVLNGGNLVLPSAITPGVSIFNYGNVKDSNGGVTVGEGAKLYSAVDIDCSSFGVNDGAELYSKASITAENVRLNGNAKACSFVAAESLTINASGTIMTSHIKSQFIEMNSGNIILDNNGLVEAHTLYLSNELTKISVDGSNAVVYASKYITNNSLWPKDTFSADIACVFEYVGVGNQYYSEEYSFNDLGLQVSDENQVAYVPATDCHAEFGVAPELPTVTELVKVSEIDPLVPDHNHGSISATCIQFGTDGTAYASYHLRGDGQKGCIEAIKDNGDSGLALGNYMISPDYDYNHILIDGDKIITIGNHIKKGAFVGMLPTDFFASEGVREDFYVKELTTDERIYGNDESIDREGEYIAIGYKNAGDGNCIVKHGENYLFTSYRGYGAITADSLKKVAGSFHSTDGSSKHIALSGDKAVILSLDSYNQNSSTASVESWSLSNGIFTQALAKYDAIGIIAPVDGKNVVAIDGDDIYVCLSHGGLARIRAGQVDTKSFGKSDSTAAYAGVPVNGIAINADHIYLAAGAFVIVLDKESMQEVCHYNAESKKSANYIAVNNDKIYVAYGEDGIMAFQLKKKTIDL